MRTLRQSPNGVHISEVLLYIEAAKPTVLIERNPVRFLKWKIWYASYGEIFV